MSESPRGYLSLPHPAPAHKAREDLVVRGLHLWALAYRDRPLHGAHHRGGCPSLHSFFGSWGLLALGLPLLPLAIPLHEGALHLGNDIRVGLGLLDAHGLVLEGEALHGTQGVGGAADLLENDKGLASHLQAS